MDEDAFAALGTLGSGTGGGGYGDGWSGGDDGEGSLSDRASGPSATRGRGAEQQARPGVRSRSENRSAPGGVTATPRASTGAGRYVPSPLGKSADNRLALAEDTPVAWSRLDLGVWFDYDSAWLRPEAVSTLVTLARRLEEMRPGAMLEIVGHTDSMGTWDYNLDLSARRANSVRSALLMAGVPSSILGTRAMGESDPVRTNRSWEGRAENRRVEFRFIQPVALRVTR